MVSDVIITIDNKECTKQDEKREVHIIRIYIVGSHRLNKSQLFVLGYQCPQFPSQHLFVNLSTATFRKQLIELVK